MSKLLSAAVLAALGAVCLTVTRSEVTPATSTSAQAPGSANGWCTASDILAAEAPRTIDPAVCDPRGKTVRAGVLSAAVPPPGLSVQADALMPVGHQELTVHTGADGTVIISQADPGPATATSAAVAAPATAVLGSVCRDPGYMLAGYQLTSRYDWYYNPGGAPATVARTAGSAISRATAVVSTGINRCGRTATLGASSRYLGTTTRPAQVSRAGSCTGDDHRNVTGWGIMDSSFLAVTCTYFDGQRRSVASDALLNRAYSWFTTRPPGCTYSFNLLSVMVHERGHTFGLGHVNQQSHGTAVMTPTVMACSTAKQSLSYGDYLGLVKLYGLR